MMSQIQTWAQKRCRLWDLNHAPLWERQVNEMLAGRAEANHPAMASNAIIFLSQFDC